MASRPSSSSSGGPDRTAPGATGAAFECPRCGYGLGGTFAPAAPAWPLECVCPECGLALESRALHAERTQLRWFVETPRSAQVRRWFPRRAVGTLLRTLRPWRFWSAVGMERPIRPRLLAGYALVLALMAALWCDGIALSRRVRWLGPTAAMTPSDLPGRTWLDLGVHAVLFWYPGNVIPLNDWLVEHLIAPPKPPGWVAPRNVFRGGYACLDDCTIPSLQRLVSPIAALACAYGGSVAAFVVLPIARRRAKVRWRHIARASIYGCVTVWPFLAATLLTSWLDALGVFSAFAPFTRPLADVRGEAVIGWCTMALQLVVFISWWHAVTRRYLRMERPLAVALAVTAVGAACGATLPFLTFLGPQGLISILFTLRLS